MMQQQLIIAIGRIERALSRIEQVPRPAVCTDDNTKLQAKHEQLKSKTVAAIAELDQLISGQSR